MPIEYGIVESIELSVPSDYKQPSAEEIAGKDETGTWVEAGVSKAVSGSFVLTKGLLPCQLVVAELKNGQFAIYHAFTLFQGEDFQEFVAKLKKYEVNEVYVFQKPRPRVNTEKAPILTMALMNALQHEVKEVKRIELDDYRGVICDAKAKQVIIVTSDNFKCTPSENKKQTGCEIRNISEIKPINMEFSIPLTKTIEEVQSYNRNINDPSLEIKIPSSLLANDLGKVTKCYEDIITLLKPRADTKKIKKQEMIKNLINHCTLQIVNITDQKSQRSSLPLAETWDLLQQAKIDLKPHTGGLFHRSPTLTDIEQAIKMIEAQPSFKAQQAKQSDLQETKEAKFKQG